MGSVLFAHSIEIGCPFFFNLFFLWNRVCNPESTVAYAQSVRHDLNPNIFPSGPPTQSISTYNIIVIHDKKEHSLLLVNCSGLESQ